MEDGVNESTKKANSADKAGWLKKSSGGLLGHWKDRYILLSKGQLLVYENEDEQNCLETVELENYDRCQDLRALLKSKNRFIVIRSPGKKVNDIKFQAKNLQEKDIWIKSFNDSIEKGRNRVLDEVKVDPTCSLDHVTRDRVKVAQGRRRPPTRIHLKEVADGVSDGIMRLDLDMVDNGPQSVSFSPDTGEDETEPPPKENYKPPMPPSKPSLPSTTEEDEDEAPADGSPALERVSPPPMERAASEDKLNFHQASGGESSEDMGEAKAPLATSQEDLTKEPPKHATKAPVPPPKVLSDKMKVKWDEPSLEHKDAKLSGAMGSSKENLTDVVEKEACKPPIPPPKILTGNLKMKEEGLSSSRSSLDVIDRDAEELGGLQTGAREDFPETGAPKEIKVAVEPKGDKEANGKKPKEGGDMDERSLAISAASKERQGMTSDFLGLPQCLAKPVGTDPPIPNVKCSSMGDLLKSDSLDTFQLKRDHMDEMEIRLTSGREKTEMLLQQVLQGELGKDSEGNGPKTTAKTLLSEAVEQLRQATHMLQEMKDLEQSKEPNLPLQTAKPRDLIALHRRSMP